MVNDVTFGLARLTGSSLAAALVAIREGGGRSLDTCAYADGDVELGRLDHSWATVTTKVSERDAERLTTFTAVQRALVNLKVGAINRILIHWPSVKFSIRTFTWTELIRAKRWGLVDELGVCNLGPLEFSGFVATADQLGVRPVVHQFESTPLGVNQRMVDLALEHGVRPQAWSPFGGPGAPVLREPTVVDVARRYACTPAQVVVAWNIQRGVAVVVQATTVAHVRELLTPVDLDEVDVKLLSSLDRGWTSDPMTRSYHA